MATYDQSFRDKEFTKQDISYTDGINDQQKIKNTEKTIILNCNAQLKNKAHLQLYKGSPIELRKLNHHSFRPFELPFVDKALTALKDSQIIAGRKKHVIENFPENTQYTIYF